MASANPAVAEAVKPIVLDYRARMGEIVQRAHLPHKLPPSGQEMPSGFGLTAGPRKPALEGVLKPMGYSCQGGSGLFTLRRRTAANLTVELYMDVGTWSHFVLPIFRVLGIGFKASLMLPVAEQAAAGIAISGRKRGAVAEGRREPGAEAQELDRTLVPEIERVATQLRRGIDPRKCLRYEHASSTNLRSRLRLGGSRDGLLRYWRSGECLARSDDGFPDRQNVVTE